ncbi:MAG: DUF3102 domain-containing protein, partial [Oscillospiraceae bacterium]|nr:DUF3102 domain-containing protein [Oscillospiraceae bacterium]
MANKPMIGEYLAESLGNVPAAVTGERTLEQIAEDIVRLDNQVGLGLIAIGNDLIEAKSKVPHGKWGEWLDLNCGYSERKAQMCMQVARRYASNPQPVADLGLRKVTALMMLPAGEDEAFVEAHDVKNMSTRELEDAIKRQKELEQERDEALKDAEAARAEAKTAEESRAKMESDMALLKEQSVLDQENSEKLRERIKELETRPVDVAVQVDEDAIKKAADEARAAADAEWKGKFNDKLKSAVDEAVDVTNEEWQKKLNEVEDKFAKAKEKAKVAGEKSNGEVAKLKAEADRLRAELETARREQA